MTTPNSTQPTPYSPQASCELSEDYFLTQNLLIEPGDEVIPFVNPFTQMVEAIVFTQANGGSVYHLQRDPSAMGGWLPATINLTGNVSDPTSVAVAANNTANPTTWAIAPIVFTALLPSIFGAFGLQKWPNLNATVAQWIGDDAAADSMGNYVQPFIQVFSTPPSSSATRSRTMTRTGWTSSAPCSATCPSCWPFPALSGSTRPPKTSRS
jgi:hypothetical protein